MLKINPPTNVKFHELFTNGRSVWLKDVMTSSILSSRRTNAGVDVNALFTIVCDSGENVKKRAVPNQIPVKTAATLFQAKARLKPIFRNTRSLKPCRG